MNRRQRFAALSLATLAGSLFAASAAHAQTNIYWDGEKTGYDNVQNVNGASNGGTGFWTTTNADWDNGTAEVVWPNTASTVAVFGGSISGRAYQGGDTLTAGGMVFQRDGYVVDSGTLNLGQYGITTTAVGSGGTQDASASGYFATTTANLVASNLNLTANQTWTVTNGADTLLVSGVIADASGFTLTKAGAGTLTLSGANTYTGTTEIDAGVVSVSALDANGNTSNLGSGTTIGFNGGTLSYTGGGNNSFNRSITLNSGGGTLDQSGSAFLFENGVISGTGSLTKTGNGQLILTGTNTFTGGTFINAGEVQLRSAGLGNNNFTANVTVANGADLAAGGGITGTLAYNLTLNGNGNGAGALQENDGGTNITWAAPITLASDSGIGGGQDYTISGAIGGGGSALTKLSGNTITLSGTNTYTGATIISGGVLATNNLQANGANSGIGQGTDVVLNGGTLRYTGGGGFSANGGGFNRTITVGPSGGTLDNVATGYLNYDGSLAGSGTFTYVDSSGNNQQLLYTGTSDGNYVGNVVVGSASANSGFLQYRSSNANAFGSGTITVNAGGTFSADNGTTTPSTLANAFTLNGGILATQAPNMAYTGAIALAANSSVGHISNGSGNIALSGPISGTGILSIVSNVGTSAVTLSGANTYSGGTMVLGGTLLVNNASVSANSSGTGTGAVSVGVSGVSTPVLGGTGSILGATTINNGSTITGGTLGTVGTLTLQSTVTLTGGTFAVDISGATADKLVISGVLTLTNANITFNGTPTAPNYVLATFSSEMGSFSGTAPAGYAYRFNRGTELDLVAVPEPGSWVGVVLVAAWGLARRRQIAGWLRRARV